jgi:hypothetical protein
LYLSGIKGVGLSVVVTTPAIYMLLLFLVGLTPVESYAAMLDMPTPGSDTNPRSLMMNVAHICLGVFVLLVLPLIVSFGVGRIMRGRASVA